MWGNDHIIGDFNYYVEGNDTLHEVARDGKRSTWRFSIRGSSLILTELDTEYKNVKHWDKIDNSNIKAIISGDANIHVPVKGDIPVRFSFGSEMPRGTIDQINVKVGSHVEDGTSLMRLSGTVTRAGASTAKTRPVWVTTQETRQIGFRISGTIAKMISSRETGNSPGRSTLDNS
jgi:hypothetical protein